MQKKKHDYKEMRKGFLKIVLPVTAAYIILSFWPKALEREKIERPSGLERKLETKVVQTVEVNDVNEPDDSNVNDIMNYSEEDINWLTKGMYGEARGEVASGNMDYVKGYAKSVITRAKLRGKTIKDILLQTSPKKTEEGKTITVYQYTCFDPNNEENKKNYKEVNNPSDLETFELCKQTAKELLRENSFPDVTNYYVGKSAHRKKYKTKKEIRKDRVPSWAFEMKDSCFIRDKEGYLKPREPTLIAPVRQTDKNPDIKAHFYYFKYSQN